MWTCPRCGRSFRNTNQRHHCERTTASAQLQGQPEEIIRIYNKILKSVSRFGPFSESPIKDYIMLKHKSTFATLKPRKKYFDISFFLSEVTDEFPIFKSMRTSGKRVLHSLRIEHSREINSKIEGWIRQSYNLTK